MYRRLSTIFLLIISVKIKIASSHRYSNHDMQPTIYHEPIEVIHYDFTHLHASESRKSSVIHAERIKSNRTILQKRQVDPTFRGNPKTREDRWHANFNVNAAMLRMEQVTSLVDLLNRIVDRYLNSCIPIVLYDQFVENSDAIILQKFFQSIKITFLHGKINENYTIINPKLHEPNDGRCRSYIVFLEDIMRARQVLGAQTINRVVLVPRSTQWKLQEFLSSKESRDIVNLLIIGESLTADESKARPYVLYTHRLFSDGLGSNQPVVLTSWIKGAFSRPHIDLFPAKFSRGFAGHRFTVGSINQPPFVVKKMSTDRGGNIDIKWEGLEYRMLTLLAKRLNFSFEIIEPKKESIFGPTYGLIDEVEQRRIDIGMAGCYVSIERLMQVEFSVSHSMDCASFITLASKALPRYRAIMGPFQWPVWLCIIFIYLIAIFPLAFSDRLTLRHLVGNWGEIENMFWYVFGTFTNSLTFTGQFSWSSTRKTSTRMLIGWYWIFTIIITACYTSSIIAFVTLPVFPETINTISDLIDGFFRVGTFENDGWQYWFANSSHVLTKKVFKNLELVANVEEGLNNVTKAFFWPYAFLASKAQLEYIVQTNFSDENVSKRTALHISDECFAIFGVSFMYPRDSVYATRLNDAILRLQQSGLINRMDAEMKWQQHRHSANRLLRSTGSAKTLTGASLDERGLTLADTEGMFLLMGIGYLFAICMLFSEILGGCAKKCKQIVRRASTATKQSFLPNSSRKTSIASDDTSLSIPTNDTPRGSHWKLFTTGLLRYRRRSDIEPRTRRSSILPKSHKRTNSLYDLPNNKIDEDEIYRPDTGNSYQVFDADGTVDDMFRFLSEVERRNKQERHQFECHAEVNRRMSQSTGIDEEDEPIDDGFGERVNHNIT